MKQGITLCQRKNALEILEDIGFLGAKPSRFPLENNLSLSQTSGNLLSDPSQYQILVGRLIYLAITRPDFIYAIHIRSEFMDKPRHLHLEVVDLIFAWNGDGFTICLMPFYGRYGKKEKRGFSMNLKHQARKLFYKSSNWSGHGLWKNLNWWV